MTITIYDYDDNAKKIEIPAKSISDIKLLFVSVKSGDETGAFILKNDENIYYFDACAGGRMIGYDDGWYLLHTKKQIKKWLDYEPTGNETASYERQRMFY